ncbi:TonB-dependent receptor plug domain-containing protein [Frateuria defendens]|uniref:TonB-dependent receptor plug domain-containing protein n=1 Tax=Frateuria defendens TaxID=2219559 RepID=UPI00066FC0BA|nr:TonB-dependent receptor [Frateuria defendens]
MKKRPTFSQLSAAVLLALSQWAVAGSALADDKADVAADPKKTSNMQTVTVTTGTHSSERTASTSLAPVDVLSAEALKSTGATDVATALSRLEPSLNFPLYAGSDASGSQRPMSMRGLSPDLVLVLVDGKRYHTPSYINTSGQGYGTAPVDFQTLPLSAVDHIEVLRDGAAALYGSDAIAGVVNVVLKKGAKGGALDFTGGQYSAGDGRKYLGSANFGLPLGDKGWVRFDAEKGYDGRISRSQPNIFAPEIGSPGQGSTPSVQHKSFNLNGSYNITSNLELYFMAVNTWRDSVAKMNYRYPYLRYRDYSSRQIGSPANGYVGYPEWALYPQGYNPALENKTQDNELVLGLRGEIGDGWRWDVGANYGRNKLSMYTVGSINRAYYQDFGTNPNGGDFYDGTFRNKQQVLTADITKDFSLSWLPNSVTLAFGAQYLRETYSLDAGDVASYYATTTRGTAPNSGVPQAGAQGYSGYSPQSAGDWGRHSVAGYVSLETNLTDKLGVSLAGRHEKYSDFGRTTNGALSLRYDFTDNFALRGSVSSGFKAPSLAQSYYSVVVSTSYTVEQGVPVAGLYNGGIFPVTNALAQTLGARPLKPEKSNNYSLGMVWSPIDNLNLTLDVYQIDISDRITLSGSIPTVSASYPGYSSYIQNILAQHGDYASYASVQYMMNGFDTRTRGADLVADYDYAFANGGNLRSTLSFNVTGNKVTGYNSIPPSLAAVQAQFPNVPLTSRLYSRSLIKGVYEHGGPNSKLVLNENYSQGPWSFNATLTRYGAVTRYADAGHAGRTTTPLYPNGLNTTFDQRYGARWLLDLAATYNHDRWSFTLGADNVFNTYPEKNSYYNNQTNQMPYPTMSPFGFFGAYVYGKVGYHW